MHLIIPVQAQAPCLWCSSSPEVLSVVTKNTLRRDTERNQEHTHTQIVGCGDACVISDTTPSWQIVGGADVLQQRLCAVYPPGRATYMCIQCIWFPFRVLERTTTRKLTAQHKINAICLAASLLWGNASHMWPDTSTTPKQIRILSNSVMWPITVLLISVLLLIHK